MKYFTPESASRTLPLVRRIASDLAALQAELGIRSDRLEALNRPSKLATSSAHADELAEMRDSLREERGRVREIEGELASLGVQLHVRTPGAVDFPSLLGSREVRLCWMPGDPEVAHWHEVDEPAHKRRIIRDEQFSLPPSDGENRTDNGSERGPQRSLRP